MGKSTTKMAIFNIAMLAYHRVLFDMPASRFVTCSIKIPLLKGDSNATFEESQLQPLDVHILGFLTLPSQ